MKYDVKLAEGVVVRVNADNPEDAKAKALAVVLQKEGSKVYDEVFFDYETGIQDKRLRAALAVSEDFVDDDGNYISEKENTLKKYVGSSGFTRDSKGSLAITPEGQNMLGLEASKKNIIVDENKAGTAGDFADLAGYAGPVLGAITALSPQLRLMNWLKPLFLKSDRVTRAIIAGAGTAAGKGLEEANEVARGVQLQNEEKVAQMLKDEFVLGTTAQGAGETLGAIFKTYFGRTASTGNVRDSRFLMDGYDLTDIFRIDAQIATKKKIVDPGFKATRNEILKELKKQKIKPKFKAVKGIVSQGALGRTLPSRGQSIAEAVTGAAPREKRAKANLVAQMDDFFQSINRKNATIDEFVESGVVGRAAAQELGAAKSSFEKAIYTSDEKLDALLKNMLNEMNTVRNIGTVSGKELKAELKESIGQVYETWASSNQLLYNKSTEALEAAGALKPIQQHIQGYASRFKEILEQADAEDVFFQYSGKPFTFLRELAEGGKVTDLRQLISARKDLDSLLIVMGQAGKSGSNGYRVTKEVSQEIKQLLDDIANGQAFTKKGAFSGVDGGDKKAAIGAAKAWRKAQADYASNIDRFQTTIVKDVVNDIKYNGGKMDADEIFGLIDNPRSAKQIDEILNAVDPTKKEMYRGKLSKLLMQNVIKDSIDPVTGLLNPAKFSSRMRGYGETLRPLFGNKYNQNMELLREINVLNPKLNKKDLNNFLKALDDDPKKFVMAKTPGTGESLVPELDTANVILKTLKEKAELTTTLEKLNKTKFMQAVEKETPEKIVQNIFRPQSAKEINYLKANMTPEVFGQIQENAMGQLLTDAVSVGSLKSTAKLSDIFKPNNFRSAMESYGDETLEAMFGKEQLLAFKAFQQSLDLQVGGAKGLTAGGIVAGAIGASALDIALMPTIVGLKVFGNVMANPGIVRLMARTDASATIQVIDAFEKALRFTLAQGLQEGAQEINREALDQLDMMRQQIESPENANQLEGVKSQINQIQKQTAPLLDIPEVAAVNPLAQNTQSPVNRGLLGGNPATESIAESLGRLA